MRTQNLGLVALFEPSTSGDQLGLAFTVGQHSMVCRVFPATGEDLEANDMFELHTVLEFDKDTNVVTRSYPTQEEDKPSDVTYGLFLGLNNSQDEIILRGIYAWKKVVASTALIGVQGLTGYEKAT